MFILIFLLLCIILVIFKLFINKDTFTNQIKNINEYGNPNKYDKYINNFINKEQRYLDFLDNIFNTYKYKKSKVPLEDVCNPAIQELLEDESLKENYLKLEAILLKPIFKLIMTIGIKTYPVLGMF